MTEADTPESKKKRSAPVPYAEKQKALREQGLKQLEKLRAREEKVHAEYLAARNEREQLEKELGVPPQPQKSGGANGHVQGL